MWIGSSPVPYDGSMNGASSGLRGWVRAGVVLASLCSAGVAWSNSGGITGRSGKQGAICNSCHQGGKTPTVKIDGPTSLDAGMVAVYTFHIQTDAAITGMNAAATDGVKMIGDEDGGFTYLDYDEVTHARTVKPDASSGEAVYTFSITAPPYGGKIKLYAAGNACNNNQNTDGDEAASTTLDIDVNGPPKPPPPEAGPPPPKPPPVDSGPPPQQDSGSSLGDAGDDTPAPADDSGCAVGFLGDGRSTLPLGGMIGALAGVGLIARTRRKKRP